jgi:hypothetical protein
LQDLAKESREEFSSDKQQSPMKARHFNRHSHSLRHLSQMAYNMADIVWGRKALTLVIGVGVSGT